MFEETDHVGGRSSPVLLDVAKQQGVNGRGQIEAAGACRQTRWEVVVLLSLRWGGFGEQEVN